MKSVTLFTILAIFLVSSECCQIIVKIRSNTHNKFKIQVVVPAIDQQSEKILFTKPEEKKITVSYFHKLI